MVKPCFPRFETVSLDRPVSFPDDTINPGRCTELQAERGGRGGAGVALGLSVHFRRKGCAASPLVLRGARCRHHPDTLSQFVLSILRGG